MKFIGLLTHQQKQAGYFITQDKDFVYLFHRSNGNPACIAIFLYDNVLVKEIRDTTQEHLEDKLYQKCIHHRLQSKSEGVTPLKGSYPLKEAKGVRKEL